MRSNPIIVSKATFEYRRSVSGPSWRSSDCRRYLHPRSEGVPAQDVTLSVSNQSVVSSDLERVSDAMRRENLRDPQNGLWVATQQQALPRQMRKQTGHVDFKGTGGGQG